jgi:hypothetical protein
MVTSVSSSVLLGRGDLFTRFLRASDAARALVPAETGCEDIAV